MSHEVDSLISAIRELSEECDRGVDGHALRAHLVVFQNAVWMSDAPLGSDRSDAALRDLAHDLDFYEPDPKVRREDISYFDERELARRLRGALDTLAVDRTSSDDGRGASPVP